MRRISVASIVVSLVAVLTGCSSARWDQPMQVASGFTSHQVCSETFVSGLDPQQVYAERVHPTGALKYFGYLIDYEVDRSKREVVTTVAGAYRTRAVYRDNMGCLLLHGTEEIGQTDTIVAGRASDSAVAVPISAAAIVEPETEKMRAALARAFAERETAPYIHTKAVIVVKDGNIVAERYAPGVSPNTQLLGFSATKSVTNALIGILARQQKLSINQPAPIAAWQGDPRRSITIDQLMRQTAGLALDQTNSGFDINSRMLYIERDMAAFAESRPATAEPGRHWAYSDGNYILLSRIVRDAVGGHAADVNAFARRELFGPAGMNNVTLEYDATGTPLGANYMYATARDWSRFGLLYLNDGVADGKRVLPQGWVKYSTTRTPDTGYGAGFWINSVRGIDPWGLPLGMPSVPDDAYFAMGFMGQFVVVVPSQNMVVVRLGVSHHRDGLIAGMNRLVADVIAALQ